MDWIGAGGSAELRRDWLAIIKGRVELLDTGPMDDDEMEEKEEVIGVGIKALSSLWSPNESWPSGRDFNVLTEAARLDLVASFTEDCGSAAGAAAGATTAAAAAAEALGTAFFGSSFDVDADADAAVFCKQALDVSIEMLGW